MTENMHTHEGMRRYMVSQKAQCLWDIEGPEHTQVERLSCWMPYNPREGLVIVQTWKNDRGWIWYRESEGMP